MRMVDAIALADDNTFFTIVMNGNTLVSSGSESNSRAIADSAYLVVSLTFDIAANTLDAAININSNIDGTESTANQLVIPTVVTGAVKVTYNPPIAISEGSTLAWIIDSALAGAGGENVTVKGIGATFRRQ